MAELTEKFNKMTDYKIIIINISVTFLYVNNYD